MPPVVTAVNCSEGTLFDAIGAGMLLLVNVPLPSSPSELDPQHNTLPPRVRPQVCEAAASARYRSAPLTATAVARVVFEPSPNCPAALRPQQYAWPSAVNAHACAKPAFTRSTAGKPATGESVMLHAVDSKHLSGPSRRPLPSWPLLLLPQHHARFATSTAQAKSWPTATL